MKKRTGIYRNRMKYLALVQFAAAVLKVPKFSSELRFQVVGDWGSMGYDADFPNQKVVGASMAKLADQDKTHFVVSVGDNFYGPLKNASAHGVASPTDPKFNTDWLQIYNGTRMNQIPWYLILGNHDWYSNPVAQIQRTHIDSRWNLPDFIYSKRYYVDTSALHFVHISTDLFYFGYNGSISSGNIKGTATATDNNMKNNFVRLGWTPENDAINAQLDAIEWELATAMDAEYLVVVGHSDMAACDGTIPGMQPLKDLLDKYHVSAYFFGHKHALGHGVNGNTFYLLSGAGGRSEACANPLLDFVTSPGTYGFANVHVTSSAASVNFHDENLNIISSAEFYPRY
ncbi:Tartrate-resistant acid phosphatase type 5 [Terramyces sp. JEL0728]|nr:Tartrate-resistant acid phosphatase type 5 [Terramyces sp. JEL0728]